MNSLIGALAFLNLQPVPPAKQPEPLPTAAIIRPRDLGLRDLAPIEPLPAPVAAEYEELPIIVPPKPTALRNGPGGPNDYAQGNCTFFVKTKRPDLPPSMGNANQWLYSARSYGMTTSAVPVEGAVGVNYDYYLGHVVYVESVNADGSVNISEMNYSGFGVISYRTTPASEFEYIY